MDRDGYPTNAELRRISKWKIVREQDHHDLLEYVRQRWRYADVGYWKKTGRTYRVSTGGWSGNESIITAMRGNYIFWFMCWFRHERGGHYIFKVRKEAP